MKLSIIHPSRGRVEQAYYTFLNWFNNATWPFEIEYILSVDIEEWQEYKERFKAQNIRLLANGKSDIHDEYQRTAISAINAGAKISTGDVIIIVSDDTDCFKGWDTSLSVMLHSRCDFVAKVDDGIQPTLVTMPIVHRDFYERYGYIYHPSFYHMGADVELTAVAMMTGKYIKLPLTFNHLHYSTGKSPKDAINEKNDLTYQHGDEVLKEHLKTNFGIETPVIQYNEIVWH